MTKPFQILDPEGRVVDSEALAATKLTAEDCLAIYRFMLLTRLFSERAKLEANAGKIPLYISPRGQEAAEVGSAYALRKQDRIFWYSRSHGAILTRGVPLEVLGKHFFAIPDREIIRDFLSHNVSAPYVLVASHLPHAVGFAWAKKILKDESKPVAIAYFGDGGTAEPDFHSALNATGVFEIPVVFVCENNQYAISTPNEIQTATTTFAEKAAAYGLKGELVDGNDPFAVYLATKKAVESARKENTGTLIEMRTFRLDPHTTAIGELSEPPLEELMAAQEKEPLKRMRSFLLAEAGKYLGCMWTEKEDEALRQQIEELVKKSARAAYQPPEETDGDAAIAQGVKLQIEPWIDKRYESLDISPEPEIIPNATCRDAINFAYFDTMSFNRHVITLGQDIGKIGSVFQTVAIPEEFAKNYFPGLVHKIRHGSKFLPLIEIFGKERVIDMPLDENGIIGLSIGLAMGGLRPIAEIQFSGFIFKAFGQLIGEADRVVHQGGGLIPLPMVIRLPYGGGKYISHHREFEAPYVLNSPGLVVVCPSTPQDFYDLFWAAVASQKPVLFFEDKTLYRSLRAKAELKRVPPQKPLEHFGMRVAKEGNDITITAYGRLIYSALDAAELLGQEGIDAEVLDIRVFAPLDKDTLIRSVQKTGRLAVVQEEPIFMSTGAELAAIITETSESFHSLCSPILRIGPPRTHQPSPLFHKKYEPQPEEIARKIKALLES